MHWKTMLSNTGEREYRWTSHAESDSFHAEFHLCFLEVKKWETSHFYSQHFSEKRALIYSNSKEVELFLTTSFKTCFFPFRVVGTVQQRMLCLPGNLLSIHPTSTLGRRREDVKCVISHRECETGKNLSMLFHDGM